MSERKTGIRLPQDDSGRSDLAGFLTGEPEADRRRVALLLETLADVNSNLNIQDVMRSVARRSTVVAGAERALLLLMDDAGKLRIALGCDAAGRDLGADAPHSHSVVERVVREGKGVCMVDTGQQGEMSMSQSIHNLRLTAIMCVPLRVRDRLIGALYVDSRATRRGEFKPHDLTLFRAMADQVAVAIDNARLLEHYVEKQRMAEELAVAQKIQRSLLPRGDLPLPGIEVHGVSEACDETSGDYFDVVPRPDGRIGIAVGDVAGHGLGAALMMAMGRALLRAQVAVESDLGRLMTRVNRSFAEDVEPGSFMTLFYAEVDPAAGQLHYVGAGHEEAVVFHRATDSCEVLGEGGPALGVIGELDYAACGPVALAPGDLLLLCTDGICETRNQQGEVFGFDRLQELLRQHRDLPVREIVARMRAAVGAFSGSGARSDDVTLVVARLTGVG